MAESSSSDNFDENKIDIFLHDMSDMKEAVINLLEPLKKINEALRVLSDNQNHLNGKLNTLIKLQSKTDKSEETD